MLTLGSIHHVALEVADVETSERWYSTVLGAEVDRRTDVDEADLASGRVRQVWMRVGELVVNLAQGRPIERGADQHFVHVAVRSVGGTLAEWITHLREHGVEVLGPYGHGGLPFVSLYFDDPDGYRWEIIVDFDSFEAATAESVRLGGRLGNPVASYDWH
ncbi:MAG: VOC family protein [Nocardioides sp.]